MHHLHSVYDISSSLPPIKPLFFMGLLAFISVSAYVFKRRGNEFFLFKRMSKLGALLGAIFCVIIMLVASVVLLGQYFDNKHVYESKQLRFVEGNVTGYRPMHSDKHRLESFDVKGVHFEYSDYDLSTGGYNNTADEGGVIKPNLYVRIGYFNNGTHNIILKLDTE